MDKYRKVEKLLYNYKMLQISIKNMQEEIEFIKNDYGIQGISYDGISTSPTNKFSSSVENTALSNSEKIHSLECQINIMQRDIEKVDRTLKGLTELERSVITEKYINSKQWWQVGSKVRFSERHCRNIRKQAINKLVIGVFGKH